MVVTALAALSAMAVPTSAAACEAALPSAPAAARTAEYIVLGNLASRSGEGGTVTLSIQRTLKGNVSGTLHVGDIWTTEKILCGEGGGIDAPTGSTVIYAHNFTWHGHRHLDGYAAFDQSGQGVGVTLFVTKSDTVESVVRQILGALPPSSTLSAATAAPFAIGVDPLGTTVIAVAAFSAALMLELRRRRVGPPE